MKNLMGPAPSIRAASTSSSGMVNIYWRSRKTPVGVAAPQPDPMFPNQNVAASKVSNNVCVTWEYSEGSPDPAFYRISTDQGKTWKLHGAITAPPWALENMVVELRDGRLWTLIRTGSGVQVPGIVPFAMTEGL